jgi:hypothetical protein
MCNNRFSGVCRSKCCRPVASAAGSSSGSNLAATTTTAPQAPMPVVAPVAQVPLPVAVAVAPAAGPRVYLPIPAFKRRAHHWGSEGQLQKAGQ